MILACNPKYIPKLTEAEKAKLAAVKAALRPGCVLEFTTSDYHEDLETPPGFHEVGDRLTLVRLAERKIPVVDSKTREKVREIDVWVCKSSRWDEKECDENYLAWMTKVVP